MSEGHASMMHHSPVQVRSILFLQKPAVIDSQREEVSSLISEELPQATVIFADDVGGVPAGADFDVVITPTLPWLPDALAKLSCYRWIHFLSAGVEKIWEMDFDKTRPVMTKSSGVHAAPISEFVIGAMLYFVKEFGRFQAQSQRHEWKRTWLGELTGCQLTILGVGNVGQNLACRAKAFDMVVAGIMRRVRSVACVDRVKPLSEIAGELARTDFLAVCLPLTDETRGLVNSTLLSHLKPGAVLIDVSRGGVVRAEAVLDALNRGVLIGAALDVFEQEPLPPDSLLWQREDILITPHVSGTTPYYIQRALGNFFENLRAQQQGLPLVSPVNTKTSY